MEYTIPPFPFIPFKSGLFCYSFWLYIRKLNAEREVKKSWTIILNNVHIGKARERRMVQTKAERKRTRSPSRKGNFVSPVPPAATPLRKGPGLFQGLQIGTCTMKRTASQGLSNTALVEKMSLYSSQGDLFHPPFQLLATWVLWMGDNQMTDGWERPKYSVLFQSQTNPVPGPLQVPAWFQDRDSQQRESNRLEYTYIRWLCWKPECHMRHAQEY